MVKSTENPNFVLTDDDLHAYTDGKLSPERARQVEAYLAEHPKAAAKVADYRQINEAIRSVAGGVLEDPVPSAHVAVVRNRRSRLGLPIAAAIAGLLIGAGIGWTSHGIGGLGRSAVDQLAERASAAFTVYAPEKRHPVEVAATDDVHLATWLSNRMGMSFRIPRLGDLGLDLVGGRLLVDGASPAALLMYENDEGRRIVLYVRNDPTSRTTTSMTYVRQNAAGVITWADEAVGFGLAGNFSERELRATGELIRAQLSS